MKEFFYKIKKLIIKKDQLRKYLLPITALVLILIVTGFFVYKFAQKPETAIIDASLSNRAETYSAMTNRQHLIFTELSADPFVVYRR